MKKIPKTFSESYGPVVIWADDIIDIWETLKERGLEATISVNDKFEFHSAEEAVESYKGQALSKIAISFTGGSVRFEPDYARISISSGTDSSGLFHDINEIIKSGQRTPKLMYRIDMFIIVFILAINVPVLAIAYQLSIRSFYILIPSILTMSWFLWLLYVIHNRYSVVYMDKRSISRNFMTRNKDKLVFIFINAILLGIVNYLTNKL